MKLRLKINYDGKDYYKGDFLKVKGENEQIVHITEDGFLYNKVSSDPGHVVVHDSNDGKCTYYKNWDFLAFVHCVVVVEEFR